MLSRTYPVHAPMQKNLLYFALGASGLTALAAALDLGLGIPFGGISMVLDIVLLVSASLVIYASIESLRELK